ncbi:RecA family ATPase Rhp57 [Schizosaccharomyces japonicus yFS275]|uniref:RecA family ATPase Rhp57 n=1 Tax=Schizosaccharomyces japonicus (strain yFS275 / FY16936) TaxID=402676 RepID=B6JWI2_SCHJY|nr:RecA family ATPase Rhp57 [Schizosaccharomyces japonicus yFS275]EEB05733.1 RecA family ATPase Rhp57 [Schizosaccharomyces japonicus yFS275]
MDSWTLRSIDFVLADEYMQVFERERITTIDLLTLEPTVISERCQIKLEEVQNLIEQLKKALLPQRITPDARETHFFTTGDTEIDKALHGGIALDHITEISGESGSGKSQFCIQLCLTVQLPKSVGGLDRAAVFISTESGLETRRLFQLAKFLSLQYPNDDLSYLSRHPGDRVYTILCPDLESQEHIIEYQLPILMQRVNIGLIVLDSVAANYRAELRYSRNHPNASSLGNIATRGNQLAKLASNLRELAHKHNAAVVIANQVSDRVSRSYDQIGLFSLDYQSQWFNGWDDTDIDPKTPSLGLVWTNNVTTRLALLKRPNSATRKSLRKLRIVYSPIAPTSEIDIAITLEGLHTVSEDT